MAKCRPGKWLPWALVGAGLPLLAAYMTTTTKLTEDINSRAAQAMSTNEMTTWAKLDSSARDITLSGTAPSQEAIDMAVKTVAGTYGVRTVANTAAIVAPITLLAPTVESVTTTTATPEIKGTWQEGVANSLTVKVGDVPYTLGKSPELTTMAGNWLLKLSKPLPEGKVAVTVESSDGKTVMAAATPATVTIDLPELPKLPAPTVENYLGNSQTPTFKGTWPEKEAIAVQKNLQVKLADSTFVLGANPELKTDGAGNWTLTPSKPLAEGEISVMPGIVGADGKWQKAEAPATAVIDITPPVIPPVDKPAADLKWPFTIVGKWPEMAGNTLAAVLAGKSYEANKDDNLTTDGKGGFSFNPKVELAPGSYDVDIAVKDAAGNISKQTLTAAIVIPEPPKVEPPKVEPPKVEDVVIPAPMAAVVAAVAADVTWPHAITGTWDDKPGNTLKAAVAGRTYTLNSGAALTSDKPGSFSFLPAASFAPGSYDVDFTTTNAKGEAATMTVKAAIVVPEPVAPTPPPPPPAPPPEPLKAAVLDAAPAGTINVISGTWDDRPGNMLTANVNGRSYVLGRGAALASAGVGKFNFAPSAKFAPGSYDVDFTTTNAAGETAVTTAKAAIVIAEPAPVTPPPPPPVEIPPPTVGYKLDLTGAPIIKGWWPSTVASILNVTLDGRTYALGTDANLSSKANIWTLLPGASLKDGTYDVVVEAKDAAGNVGLDTTENELVVDVTQPVAPTVMAASGDVSPDHLSGTWDQGMAKGLKISIPQANLTAVMGEAASPLTSDGKGNWRVALAAPLPVGTYNVIAETVDKRGRVQTDSTDGEVVIVAKGVEPPPPPQPYDCVAVMNRIANVFPIRFEYDLTDITKPFDVSVSQYAALLKDPRCTSLNVEIKGHADFRGSEVYNMGLSERRAAVIMGMFEKAGVGAARMSTKGYGKTQPLDAALTDEARAKNRRVEISVKP
jgi:outer membrane protein OmpA-like peptidoglycan-associated protein